MGTGIQLTGLTEEDIRQLTDKQSFQRGMAYYASGAILAPVYQGQELRGECRGSQRKTYKVKVILAGNHIREAFCTCPRGGFCKHLVALLLTYLHKPDTFRNQTPLEATLADCSTEELIALIKSMVQREPSLLALVERTVAMPPASPVDMAMLRREVGQALRHQDLEDVEADLQDLLRMAEKRAHQADWLGAGTVYQVVLDSLSTCYEDELSGMDEDGDIAVIAGDCVDGLNECLDAINNNCSATRLAWLGSILVAELADIKMGGIDFAGDAVNVVMAHATKEEWLLLEKPVLDLIPASDGWEREALVNLLATGRKNHGHDDESCRIIREMGTEKQRMFLLVQEKQPAAAVAMASKHFAKIPGVIVNLAQALAEFGAAEHGVTLVTQLAGSEDPHPAYLEWLSEYHLKMGKLEEAFAWQRAIFVRRPAVKSYTLLRELSERIGDWAVVRSEVLQILEAKNNVSSLLEIALHEGDVARALELLPRAPRGGWRNYQEEVARAAEQERPLDAIALYQSLAESAIGWRQRKNYSQAAVWLCRVKLLYERLGRSGEWGNYVTNLRKEYARLPALQEELKKAGL